MRFEPASASPEDANPPKLDVSFAARDDEMRGPLLVGEKAVAEWRENICDMGTRTSKVFPALLGTEKAWRLEHDWKLSGPLSHQVPEHEASTMTFEDGLSYLARRGLVGVFTGQPDAKAVYREKTELGRVSGSGQHFMAEAQELLTAHEPIAEHLEEIEGRSIRHTLTPAQMCSYQGWIHAREEIRDGKQQGPEESFIMMEQGIELLASWKSLDPIFRPS